ncbi:MAG: purine-binding chemotaxis protein CheW [Proteobacteria bacterium]|nr:purine-binding chemotaxis protein CheW [Pseudomonadota bacterium]
MNTRETPDLERWHRELLEILQADAACPEEGPARKSAKGVDRLEVLAFEVAGETYALSIQVVTEIVLPRPITSLPRAPGFVLGVASLRGVVVPVVDLAQRLRLPPAEPCRGSRILVLRDGEDRMGFWVDRVQGVMRFSSQELEAADFATTVDPRYLQGIGYQREGELVALLDGARLCDFELGEP